MTTYEANLIRLALTALAGWAGAAFVVYCANLTESRFWQGFSAIEAFVLEVGALLLTLYLFYWAVMG